MHVAELWRYPVKSLAGERLGSVEIRPDGLVGDRLVQVYDARGRVVTARTRPGLLGHRGTLGPDGEPRIDGWPWSSPAAASLIVRAAGLEARLDRFAGEERFDVLPLLVRRTARSPPSVSTGVGCAPTSWWAASTGWPSESGLAGVSGSARRSSPWRSSAPAA